MPCLPTSISSTSLIFWSGVRTEISYSSSPNSFEDTGGNRGSWKAAASAISTIVLTKGFSARMWPIQPLSLPSLWRVTNAPRVSFKVGESTTNSGVFSPRQWDSTTFRAISSSCAFSSEVSPKFTPTLFFLDSFPLDVLESTHRAAAI